jgi:hypothetical protein
MPPSPRRRCRAVTPPWTHAKVPASALGSTTASPADVGIGGGSAPLAQRVVDPRVRGVPSSPPVRLPRQAAAGPAGAGDVAVRLRGPRGPRGRLAPRREPSRSGSVGLARGRDCGGPRELGPLRARGRRTRTAASRLARHPCPHNRRPSCRGGPDRGGGDGLPRPPLGAGAGRRLRRPRARAAGRHDRDRRPQDDPLPDHARAAARGLPAQPLRGARTAPLARGAAHHGHPPTTPPAPPP